MESNNILASKIRRLAEQGEGVQVEFKECNDSISKNIYETVCAFLNRSGGELLLGVNDSGRIIGVDKLYLSKIKADFTTAINNPQKISPSFYLSMEDVVVDNKTILYIYVPESVLVK